MKKIKLIVLFLWTCNVVFAQNKELKQAKDYLYNYQASRKIADLEKAIENIKIAIASEKLANDPSTLYFHGLIHKTYYDALAVKSPELVYTAYNSLKKALTIKPKFEDKDQAIIFIKYLGFDMYGIGIEQFNAKNNDKAFEAYKNLIDLNQFLNTIGEKLALTDPNTKELAEVKTSDIVNNYVVFAINANKKEEAAALLKKEIVSNPSEIKYLQIIQLLQENPDKTEYKKWLQEAILKYPNNVDIIIADINFNIAEKNTTIAIEKLNKLISLDPKNKQYYLLLGNLYENQKDMANAKKTYKTGLEIAPEDYEMNYNCGAISYNEAVNAYNSTKNVKTKTNNYLILFAESKKFFEKCKALRPEKSEVDSLIKKINEIK
jgi:tetratricopeptide (TPR) repeat protein